MGFPNNITCSFIPQSITPLTKSSPVSSQTDCSFIPQSIAPLKSSPVSSQTEEKKKELTMIARRISQPAKRWQRMVALGKKHLTWETTKESDECCAPMAGKGHCVVYTTDGMRFEVPLAYLGKKVFEELLRMSHEEFGFTSDGRITLPCDAATMEYAMCLLRRSVSEEVEKAFLSTMAMPHNYATCLAPPIGVSRQVTVCSF